MKKIIIVGGGTAGWMTAAAISKLMSHMAHVTLVESCEIAPVGVGEATIPPLQGFHKLLGIDEREFVSSTHATFKLGIEFIDWDIENTSYFHSFGNTGRGFWGGDFQHLWRKGLDLGINRSPSDYCLETQAAYAGKFSQKGPKKLNYAYHFDAGLYAQFLQKFSCENGAEHIQDTVKSVNISECTGSIKNIVLTSGDIVSGDFFIDCTGFKGLLIEKALHSGYESWAHWLLCDRAVAVQSETIADPLPYTRSRAHDFGWQWQIPLQTRMGNGFVYSSQYLDAEPAESLLLKNIGSPTINNPRHISFCPGKRRRAWIKNCLAIGLSSGFIEPLESTSLHLIMTGVMRFLALFPEHESQQDILSSEYNDQFNREIEDVRDFVIAHYFVGSKGRSRFWDYCRDMQIPNALANRIELFRSSGQLMRRDDELFRVDSWVQVLIGQGLVPENYHAGLAAMPEEELVQFLEGYADGIAKYVSSLPDQKVFLSSYCS